LAARTPRSTFRSASSEPPFSTSVAYPTPSVRATLNRAAACAAPMFVAGTLALATSVDRLKLPLTAAPIRIGIILVALAAGVGLTTVLDRPGSRPYWQMGLFATLILMPIVALQASASRAPFVAIARGSAGPLIWLTLAACLVLIGLWLFATYQSGETPENAALLFLPAALLIPATMGAAGSLDEMSALAMLAESSFVAGTTILLALLSPPNWRPAAGGVALGAQFLLLWTLGRGPVIGREGGAVVPVTAALLLGLTVLLTVLAPLGALFSRRFFQTMEEEFGERKPASVPSRGARRRSDT
jgi:hypothetical protein